MSLRATFLCLRLSNSSLNGSQKLYSIHSKIDQKTGEPNRNQAVVLFDGPVTPGQRINLEQTIQGGGASPLRIGSTPIYMQPTAA